MVLHSDCRSDVPKGRGSIPLYLGNKCANVVPNEPSRWRKIGSYPASFYVNKSNLRKLELTIDVLQDKL
jgi:hypothetical protein